MNLILKVALFVLCVIVIITSLIMYNISEQLIEINKLFEDLKQMIDQTTFFVLIN